MGKLCIKPGFLLRGIILHDGLFAKMMLQVG